MSSPLLRLLVALPFAAVLTSPVEVAASAVRDEPAVHRRIETPHGPVHVFVPRGYEPKTAGTVVYVHGYYDDVDEAWAEHKLADQFKASRRNALFIVPEAPEGDAEPVRWKDLTELLSTVSDETGFELPKGPLIAMAHSGGIRTVVPWLESPWLDHVVLLDALYTGEDALRRWVDERSRVSKALMLVGELTHERSEKLLGSIEGSKSFDRIPERVDTASPAVLFRSPDDHMGMVEEGRVIPAVLRLTPLRRASAG